MWIVQTKSCIKWPRDKWINTYDAAAPRRRRKSETEWAKHLCYHDKMEFIVFVAGVCVHSTCPYCLVYLIIPCQPDTRSIQSYTFFVFCKIKLNKKWRNKINTKHKSCIVYTRRMAGNVQQWNHHRHTRKHKFIEHKCCGQYYNIRSSYVMNMKKKPWPFELRKLDWKESVHQNRSSMWKTTWKHGIEIKCVQYICIKRHLCAQHIINKFHLFIDGYCFLSSDLMCILILDKHFSKSHKGLAHYTSLAQFIFNTLLQSR